MRGEARSLAVVGLSHHSAPVEVRERFIFSPAEAEAALVRLKADGVAREAVMLSTCNRTELYLHLEERAGGGDELVRLLAAHARLPVAEAELLLSGHRGRAVAEHLFRVVTSLESMILGEAQIQGQVRGAYERAAAMAGEVRVAGPVLSRLFQTALAVGGRVRGETALGIGAASIPAAAVELAKKIFGSLAGRRALVLGAGEMGELALECLVAAGVRGAVVASRTRARAERLAARFGATAIDYDEVASVLPSVEVVATATAAPQVMLDRALFDKALPGGPKHPLLLVDIAIPRDVDPSVGEIENVFLYGIDDLRQIIDHNLERRRAEVPLAERIVGAAADEFWSWFAARDAAPLIRELRDRAELLRQTEVEKALRKLAHLGDEDRAAVEQLTRALLNKVLHRPTVRLREAASNGQGVAVLHAARYLFELEPEGDVNELETGGD